MCSPCANTTGSRSIGDAGRDIQPIGFRGAVWQLYPTGTTASNDRCLGSLLPQITAEALDAFAGFLEVGGLGRIGDAERRPNPERLALHDSDPLFLQQFDYVVFVIV